MTEIQLDTRQRLLEAAAQVFAEKGFHAASVRDIVERAGANVAAVNYHFGSKEALYLEVLRGTCRSSKDRFGGLQHDGPPEERIRRFVRGFLEHLLSDTDPMQARIFMRELSDPTSALDTIIEEAARPVSMALSSLVKELCPGLADRDALLCAQSVIAQCVFRKSHQAFLERLQAEPSDLDTLTEHIVAFSLAGIRAKGVHHA